MPLYSFLSSAFFSIGLFLVSLATSAHDDLSPTEHKSIERIVALSPHSVELLFALGVGEKIVATVEYADYPPEAKKILRVGNYNGIQVEKVLALQPDLVLGWKSGNKTADLEKLQSLGLNIHYTHPKNIPQIFEDILRIGREVNATERAEQLASELREKYLEIKTTYQDLRPVSVFYQLWHDPLRSVGPESWIASLINDCQGQSIFHESDSDYPLVSIESVVVNNPEVIIIPHHSGDVGAKKELWNKWPELKAIKNDNVFTLSGDLLHRFGPRALEGLSLLCESIHQARR